MKSEFDSGAKTFGKSAMRDSSREVSNEPESAGAVKREMRAI